MAKHIIDLENVRFCVTRMIPGVGEMAYEDCLKRFKLPTLSYHHLMGDMIETYKIIIGVYDRDVTEGLFLRKDSNTRGQRYKISKEWPRLEVKKHTFSSE